MIWTLRKACTLHRMTHPRLGWVAIVLLFLCAALLPAQSTKQLDLAVTGDVPTPLSLTAADLAKMPRERVDVGEPAAQTSTYEGVSLQEILKKAGIAFGPGMRGKALAGYVIAEATDGYEVVFSLGELEPDLGAQRVIVADKRDGKALPPDQGPARLVLPADKEGARSVRMLDKLEVVKLLK